MNSSSDENEPLIPLKELCTRLGGVSRTTVWRMEKAGQIPKSVIIGQRTKAWLPGEIRDLINRLAAERDH